VFRLLPALSSDSWFLSVGWVVLVAGFVNPFRYYRRIAILAGSPLAISQVDVESWSTAGVYVVLEILNDSPFRVSECTGEVMDSVSVSGGQPSINGSLQWSTRCDAEVSCFGLRAWSNAVS